MNGIDVHAVKAVVRESWDQTFRLPQPFLGLDVEQRFVAYYRARFALIRRVAGALGFGIWTAHILLELTLRDLDPIGFGPSARILLLLRAGTSVVIACVALCSLSKRMETAEGFAEILIFSAGAATLGASLAMKVASPAPYDYLYYFDGLLVCVLFFFGMFRLRAKHVASMLLVNGVGYLVSLIAWSGFGIGSLISLILLSTVSTIGYAISVQLEQSERRSFLAQQDLSKANDDLHIRNLDIEELNSRLAKSMAESTQRSESLLQIKDLLRQEAEQRSRDKSRFLALSVHDLKQPVQAISSALYAARYAQAQSDAARLGQSLVLADMAAAAMREQLAAILDISRLESGVVKADVSAIDLARTVKMVVDQQAGVAREQYVDLRIVCKDQRPRYVLSDRAFLARILTNLIGNAIKYRDATKHAMCEVVVTIGSAPIGTRISVSDNGIGIEPKHLEHGAIFDPFFRVSDSGLKCEGVGLGLSVVRAMVAVLDGHSISVQSVYGQGTNFDLDIPQGEASSGEFATTELDLESPADAERLAGAYIVLVEDNKLVNQTVAATLETRGALCEQFDDYGDFAKGAPTLERIPDVLVTDYRLNTEFTGVDVIRLARSLFDEVPILVISGEMGELLQLNEFGSVQLLRKPIDPRILLDTIDAMLSNKFSAESPRLT